MDVSTYERPAEVNNEYYELWKHYIATYDELKNEHTPCTTVSLKNKKGFIYGGFCRILFIFMVIFMG
jgi:hypothetical protein